LLLAAGGAVSACSGEASSGQGAGGPTLGSNAVPVVVNAGPDGAQGAFVNGLFVSVTLCVPGTTNCQTIDGITVDTGSSGLRVLSSALTIPLAPDKDANGNTLANCMPFEDGSYLFGPVARADVQMAGEKASSIPIQIAADPTSAAFPKPPDACSSGAGQNQGSLAALGSNGIMGLDFYQQDCGPQCITDTSPAIYFRCSSSSCAPATAPLASQVTNPVSAFAADNNGIAITLPAVPANGAVSVTGALTFGIGTQANNGLGGAAVVEPQADGTVTTLFRGQPYPSSSIDSGSNAYFFLDPKASGIAACQVNTDFYCPTPSIDLSALLVGTAGTPQGVSFSVANADTLFGADDNAFDDLAGPNTPLVGFLWGLPFFFDRTVFTGFESPDGKGAFWAYSARP
jgi:hypothetical protein